MPAHDRSAPTAARRATRTAALIAGASLLCAAPLAAQGPGATPPAAPATTAAPVARDGVHASAFRRLPPRDGFNVWLGGSVLAQTASDNETIQGGSMRILGVQWTRDLFAWHRARFSWVTEALPLMLVSSSAPPVRIPAVLREPDHRVDPKQAARYFDHDSWGVGISPLSAQAEIPHSPRFSTVVQVTSGVAWFSKVVPYGQATQANFTVSPGASLQWQASPRTRVAFGYTLHHVSNASFGGSNPGMNSHIFYTRLTALRMR